MHLTMHLREATLLLHYTSVCWAVWVQHDGVSMLTGWALALVRPQALPVSRSSQPFCARTAHAQAPAYNVSTSQWPQEH